MSSKKIFRPLLAFVMAVLTLAGIAPNFVLAQGINADDAPETPYIYIDGERVRLDDERILNVVSVRPSRARSARPNVQGIVGVSDIFEMEPDVKIDGVIVHANRYLVTVDDIDYEGFCADPKLRGPENAGAVYELSGEANARLKNALKNGFPLNTEWSTQGDTEERMWYAYVTRVAVAMANNPTHTFTGDADVLDEARNLANGVTIANHAAYPPIMVNGDKDAQDIGRTISDDDAQSEAFAVTYNRKTSVFYNPFRFEWAAGTPDGAKLLVDGTVVATAPDNPDTIYKDNITSFQIEMPNTAEYEGQTAAVNLVGIHNQFADTIWLLQNPNNPTGWQDIVFYIPEVIASAAFSFQTPDEPDKASLRIIKRNPSGKGLAGAKFEITGPDGYSKQATTPSNGIIKLTGLEPGEYTVTETAPPAGHKLAEPASATVTIAPGETGVVDVVFVNEPDGGGDTPKREPKLANLPSVRIQKVDALTRENIPGALVRIRGGSSFQMVTGDGQIWELDNTGINISVVLTEGATLPVVPEPSGGGEDGEEEGRPPMSFELTDGVLTIHNIPWGYYSVEEERAPDGYSLLPQHTAYSFWALPPNVIVNVQEGGGDEGTDEEGDADGDDGGITSFAEGDDEEEPGDGDGDESGGESGGGVEFIIDEEENVTSVLITFENYPFGEIEVTKYDEITGQTLAGAHFRIQGYFPEGNTNGMPIERTEVTGGDGKVVFDSLPAGQYTISEVQAPPGYLPDSTAFRSVSITWGETASTTFYNTPKSSLEVLKIDGDTGAPLGGAIFTLRDPATGETWQAATNGSGIALLGKGSNGNELIPGKTYLLTEIQAPSGYVLIAEPREVVLSPGDNNRETVRNYKNPTLTIIKRDIETGAPLAGAVFTVNYENGQTVSGSPFTTDANGQIVLPWTLFEGNSERTLIVTEITPPPGYILSDPNWQRVTMRLGENNVVTFDNYKKPTLTLIKYDELTNLPLAGASFRLWKTEGETWEERQITDANGRITWVDLDPGIYSVQEIDEPYGYFRDPARKEILLNGGDNKVLEFFNRPRPILIFFKRDAVTGRPLAGTKFRVQRLEGETIGEFLTDANGRIELSPATGYLLEEKIYRVTEITPPIEYLLDVNPTKDALLKWYEPTELIFENLLKPTLIFIKKDGMSGRGITGATYRVQYESSTGGITTLGSYVTKCGLIVLPYVTPGWYVLTETSPAPGYQLPTNPTVRMYLAPGENSYTYAQTQTDLYVDPRTNPNSGSRGMCGDWCGYLCSVLCAGNCGNPGDGTMSPGGTSGGFGNITITNGKGDPLGGGTTTPTDPPNPPTDPSKPALTAGTVTRVSDLTATVQFTSSAAGRYYYSVVNSGANAPAVGTGGLGAVCSAGANTITVYMTAGAKDVYIKVKDADGNVSDALKVAVPAYSASAQTPAQTTTPEPLPNFDNIVITGGTVVYLNPDFSGVVIKFGGY